MTNKPVEATGLTHALDLSKSDLRDIAIELIAAIRGKRSQSWMNEKCGFKANCIYLWESGRKRIKWSDFATYCEKTMVPLAEILDKLFEYKGDVGDSVSVATFFSRDGSDPKLLSSIDLSQSSLSRIRTGVSPLFLDTFLGMLLFRNRMPLFLLEFEHYMAFPTLLKKVNEVLDAHLLMDKNIETPFVAIALDLQEYIDLEVHSDEFLAKKLKIPEYRIQSVLHDMHEKKLVKFENQKYIPTSEVVELGNVETSSDRTKNILLSMMNKIASDYRDDKVPEFKMTYEVISVDQHKKKAIYELIRKMRNELHEIAISQPVGENDEVLLFSYQLLPYS